MTSYWVDAVPRPATYSDLIGIFRFLALNCGDSDFSDFQRGIPIYWNNYYVDSKEKCESLKHFETDTAGCSIPVSFTLPVYTLLVNLVDYRRFTDDPDTEYYRM